MLAPFRLLAVNKPLPIWLSLIIIVIIIILTEVIGNWFNENEVVTTAAITDPAEDFGYA